MKDIFMELQTYTKDTLKSLFDAVVSKMYETTSISGVCVDLAYLTHVYVGMFHEFPHIISISSDGYYLNPKGADFLEDLEDEDEEYHEKDDEDDVYTFEDIIRQSTMINLAEHFKDTAYIVRKDEYPLIIGDHTIIFYSDYDRTVYILQNKEYLTDDIKTCVVDKKSDNNARYFSYITNTGQGFNETSMKVKKQDIDLAMNYNDDLPHDNIVSFIKGNQSGLVLLHGDPGTGKSTYIRYLMHTLTGRNFIVLDASTFHYITDASFIDLLLQNKNAVIILEDCEDMLVDRIAGNAQLATLLNLSDGIIGDSFNFKFICTFNANITKLDKAILRKGRLKQKYEFKALTPEKTKALADKIGMDIPEGKSLTLAEIFNYDESNGNEKTDKRIGFSK